MYWITCLEGGPQRVNHAAVAISSKIYSFGGYNSEGEFKLSKDIDIHVFDADTLRWRPVHYVSSTGTPKKCYGHTVVAYGSKVYLWGGRSNLSASNTLYCFDTVNLIWHEIKATGAIPKKVDGHSACVIADTMYVFGGYEEESEMFTNSVYCISLITYEWKKVVTTGERPTSRDFHTASAVEDRMYIFGGRGAEVGTDNRKEFYSNEIMYLDTTNNKWEKPVCFGEAPCGRRSHSSVVYNNEIYIVGGFDGETRYHLNDIYRFSPVSKVWSKMYPKGNPPCPRRRHCTCVIGEHLFLFGGSSPRDQEKYAQQYVNGWEDASSYHLQLTDHSDTHILDFFPSLKRLCQLKVIKYMLRTDYLPQYLQNEIKTLKSITCFSQLPFTIYPRQDFPAVGFSA